MGFGGLLIALVSLITGFILQRDQKSVRELKDINDKYKKKLLLSLNAIKGYQCIETKLASDMNLDESVYRRKVRGECQDCKDYLNSDFVSPKNIDEIINELQVMPTRK